MPAGVSKLLTSSGALPLTFKPSFQFTGHRKATIRHQGDHFRFWMLIQLLNSTLFNSADEMVRERHRLNAVGYRRTKADSCRADGSPVFARRWVHTESFVMSQDEQRFYEKLREYLEDGFAL